MWLSLAIFNGGVIRILQMAMGGISMKDVLREKNPDDQPNNPTGETQNPSYSRLAGFIGATVMGCFLWGIGNFLIYASFADSSAITNVLDKLGTYFLAGASLFTPYAFNQMKTIFKAS